MSSDLCFGNEAYLKKKDKEYTLHYPVQRGIIEHDHMGEIWDHMIKKMDTKPQQGNVLISDYPLNTKENKCKTAEVLFEQGVQSLAIMNSAALSLFSTGRTTGLVIESGQGVTYAVPIFEGYALPHAIQTMELAGQDITQNLFDSLVSQGIDIDHNHFEHVREIKEQMCEVAFDYEHALKSKDPLSDEQKSYELPDSKEIIQVERDIRFGATEILFDQQLAEKAGHRDKGVVAVHELAYNAIEKCDPDLQISLYNNIVLAGGTTMLPGFKERFEHELFNLASSNLKTDISITADLHRKYAAWIGGSMIGSLSTFNDMTIKNSDYNDLDANKTKCVLQKTIF